MPRGNSLPLEVGSLIVLAVAVTAMALAPVLVLEKVAVEVEVELVAIRSQDGHMVKVVAGNCILNGFDDFKALNS